MSGTQLVRYDAMCLAIAEAYAVDEVKEIRDRALAMQMYAQQARNTEAETKACEIRLRAERRCGQLLAESEKAKRGPDKHTGQASQRDRSDQKTLSDLGISYTQSSRWQKLAAIPDDEFEATFAAPDGRPSTSGIIARHETQKPKDQVNPKALWLWGRLLDFERQGLLDEDPNILLATMLTHMRETTLELVPKVIAWLERIRL